MDEALFFDNIVGEMSNSNGTSNAPCCQWPSGPMVSVVVLNFDVFESRE